MDQLDGVMILAIGTSAFDLKGDDTAVTRVDGDDEASFAESIDVEPALIAVVGSPERLPGAAVGAAGAFAGFALAMGISDTAADHALDRLPGPGRIGLPDTSHHWIIQPGIKRTCGHLHVADRTLDLELDEQRCVVISDPIRSGDTADDGCELN